MENASACAADDSIANSEGMDLKFQPVHKSNVSGNSDDHVRLLLCACINPYP